MWAQPWAWLGLVGLAVPIAIHMLARRQAARTLFPSLRFIDVTDVTFIKRQRLTDVPLLLVRLALVIAAAAALAGPRMPLGAGGGTGSLALAVVVDASESAGGARAGSAAMTAASTAAVGASASSIIQAESLRAGIESAGAWLGTKPGRGEIVVVSDFQRGSIADRDVEAVPAGAGLRFVRVPMSPLPLPAGLEWRGDRSRMSWAASSIGAQLPIDVRAGSAQESADAMLAAVASVASAASGPASASHHVSVIFPGAGERAALVASQSPISQPWMFTVARPLLDDQQLSRHVVLRASGDTLAVLLDLEPVDVLAAAAVSSLLQALQQPLPRAELEPLTMPDETLRVWERAPTPTPSPNSNEPQHRWMWIVVLALVAVETLMRRHRSPAARKEPNYARVA